MFEESRSDRGLRVQPIDRDHPYRDDRRVQDCICGRVFPFVSYALLQVRVAGTCSWYPVPLHLLVTCMAIARDLELATPCTIMSVKRGRLLGTVSIMPWSRFERFFVRGSLLAEGRGGIASSVMFRRMRQPWEDTMKDCTCFQKPSSSLAEVLLRISFCVCA